MIDILSALGWGLSLVLAVWCWRLIVENRRLEAMAYTDSLTGALSRRAFEQALQREYDRLRRLWEKGRANAILMVLVFDIREFDKVNNLFGHATGDEVLRKTVLLVQAEIRESDAFARIGGDEFALCCEIQGDLEEATRAAIQLRDRLREKLSDIRLNNGAEHRVRVNVGAAWVDFISSESPASMEDVLERADKDMYAHKYEG